MRRSRTSGIVGVQNAGFWKPLEGTMDSNQRKALREGGCRVRGVNPGKGVGVGVALHMF